MSSQVFVVKEVRNTYLCKISYSLCSGQVEGRMFCAGASLLYAGWLLALFPWVLNFGLHVHLTPVHAALYAPSCVNQWTDSMALPPWNSQSCREMKGCLNFLCLPVSQKHISSFHLWVKIFFACSPLLSAKPGRLYSFILAVNFGDWKDLKNIFCRWHDSMKLSLHQ